MKRFILFVSLTVSMASLTFGEDAAVLPAGVLRVDADAAIGFVGDGWNFDGKKVDVPDAVIIGTALGTAYGFTEWFTAVLCWSPGLTDTDLTSIDIGNDGDGAVEIYEGLSDFSCKAQFQIIGNTGLLENRRFRVRLTPGIVIPFPGIDDKDSSGNHTWGVGGEVSFDTLFSDSFFVNGRSEFYWFPRTAELKLESSIGDKGTVFLEYQKQYNSRFFFTENKNILELTLNPDNFDEKTRASIETMSAVEQTRVLKSVFVKSEGILIEPDEDDNVINFWRRLK